MIDAVFDSNILIDHLNGISQARATIENFREPAISLISWIEVLSGADPEEGIATRNFLEQFTTVPITSELADAAVLLRRSRRYKLPDAIILATAQVLGCVLVTRNTRDFDRSHPGIEVPYEV